MRTTVLTLAILFASASAAAEPLTRAQAIARAAEQNPEVAAARAEVEAARSMKAQANAARWPELTLDLGIGPSVKADLVPGSAVESVQSSKDIGLDDLTYGVGGELRVLQPLFTFGKIQHRRDAADHGIRARHAQAEITALDTALAVARLYEQLLFARDASLFFDEIGHTLERSVLSTKDRIARGATDVSDQDVIRLEVALSAARIGQHHVNAGVAQAEAGLRAYLGYEDSESLELAPKELKPVAIARADLENLSRLALEHRPELVALTEGALAFDKLAAAERAGYLPDFFVMAWLRGIHTPGRDDLETRYVVDPLKHFDPGILLGVRWTLQGSMSGARADEHRARAASLRERRRWAEAGLPAEVRVAFAAMQRAEKDMNESEVAVKRAKSWMVMASADYSAGLGDSRSVEDAVEAYALMRLGFMDAIMRFNIAVAELASATGTLVEGGTYGGAP